MHELSALERPPPQAARVARLPRAEAAEAAQAKVAVQREPDGELMARQTVAIVLAGGRGSRLCGLTDERAKPAICFGGSFRVIDFVLSNCVNSGIRRVAVCTQYKAQSLIRHVQQSWDILEPRLGEFIELWPAQQRIDRNWYRGTADAVYQNLDLLRRLRASWVLVLAADHVYAMDYRRMLAEHAARGADVTVGCVEVPVEEAGSYGIVQAGHDRWITGFQEKPRDARPLPGRPGRALASMGIYIFNAAALLSELAADEATATSQHDFGRDVIPRMLLRSRKVLAHDFAAGQTSGGVVRPYWRDVGTVDAFWEANLELTHDEPGIDLYDERWPIHSYNGRMPPARMIFAAGRSGNAVNSLLAAGSVVRGATVRWSILSNGVHVDELAVVEESVVLPGARIGAGAVVKRAVVDKYCDIPPGFSVGEHLERDRQRFHVTEKGVTLVTAEMLRRC